MHLSDNRKKNILALFFRFWPRRFMSDTQLPLWQDVLEERRNDFKGVDKFDKPLMLSMMAVSIVQGVLGISSRDTLVSNKRGALLRKSKYMQHVNLNHHKAFVRIIHEVGFEHYRDLDILEDGRVLLATDYIRKVRKFTDLMFRTFRHAYEPRVLLTEDKTMIEWTGASTFYTIYIANKPHPEQFCIKTVVDANSRILLGGEFVERPEEMARKVTYGAGKVAATTVRVVKPYHNSIKRVLLCDAWFGTVATARLLVQHNIEYVLNMKGRRLGFPRERLMEEALPAGQREHVRGDQAFKYIDVKMHDHGPPKRVYAALHTDNKPILFCTTGSTSKPAQAQVRLRPYRDQVTGEKQRLVGELEQPMVHQLYLSLIHI